MIKALAEYLAKYDIEHADERTCYEYYRQALEVFTYGIQNTPTEDQHSCEPDKVKSLAQYLDEYLSKYLNGETLPRELLEQALDAYESTENVMIKIERDE